MRVMTFIPREEPLEPRAAWIPIEEANRLVEDDRLESLEGTITSRALIVVGDAALLPWVPGVAYFGRDPLANGLYLPTHSGPDVPLDLFTQIVRRYVGDAPVLVHPAARTLVRLDRLGRTDRNTLGEKLERLRGGTP